MGADQKTRTHPDRHSIQGVRGLFVIRRYRSSGCHASGVRSPEIVAQSALRLLT